MSSPEQHLVDDALGRMETAGDADDQLDHQLWVQGAKAAFLEALHDLDSDLRNRGLSTDEALAGYPDPPVAHRRALGSIPRALRKDGLIEPSGSMATTSRTGCHGGIRRRWKLAS